MKDKAISSKEIKVIAQEMADSGETRQNIFDALNLRYPGREVDLADILACTFLSTDKESYGKYHNWACILPLVKAALLTLALLLETSHEVYLVIPLYFAPFFAFSLIVAWFARRRERVLFSNVGTWTPVFLVFDLGFTLAFGAYWFGLASLLLHLVLLFVCRRVNVYLFQDYHIHSKQRHRADGRIISISEVRFPD